MKKSKKELSPAKRDELFSALNTRFENNMKHLFVLVAVLLCIPFVGQSFAQEDAVFERYGISEPDRVHIRQLNDAFESNPGRFPRPPNMGIRHRVALDRFYTFGFGNTSLEKVLITYTDISGLAVNEYHGHTPPFSYVTHRPLTGDEVLRLIARLLADKGFRLVRTADTTVRVVEIGPGDRMPDSIDDDRRGTTRP